MVGEIAIRIRGGAGETPEEGVLKGGVIVRLRQIDHHIHCHRRFIHRRDVHGHLGGRLAGAVADDVPESVGLERLTGRRAVPARIGRVADGRAADDLGPTVNWLVRAVRADGQRVGPRIERGRGSVVVVEHRYVDRRVLVRPRLIGYRGDAGQDTDPDPAHTGARPRHVGHGVGDHVPAGEVGVGDVAQVRGAHRAAHLRLEDADRAPPRVDAGGRLTIRIDGHVRAGVDVIRSVAIGHVVQQIGEGDIDGPAGLDRGGPRHLLRLGQCVGHDDRDRRLRRAAAIGRPVAQLLGPRPGRRRLVCQLTVTGQRDPGAVGRGARRGLQQRRPDGRAAARRRRGQLLIVGQDIQCGALAVRHLEAIGHRQHQQTPHADGHGGGAGAAVLGVADPVGEGVESLEARLRAVGERPVRRQREPAVRRVLRPPALDHGQLERRAERVVVVVQHVERRAAGDAPAAWDQRHVVVGRQQRHDDLDRDGRNARRLDPVTGRVPERVRAREARLRDVQEVAAVFVQMEVEGMGGRVHRPVEDDVTGALRDVRTGIRAQGVDVRVVVADVRRDGGRVLGHVDVVDGDGPLVLHVDGDTGRWAALDRVEQHVPEEVGAHEAGLGLVGELPAGVECHDAVLRRLGDTGHDRVPVPVEGRGRGSNVAGAVVGQHVGAQRRVVMVDGVHVRHRLGHVVPHLDADADGVARIDTVGRPVAERVDAHEAGRRPVGEGAVRGQGNGPAGAGGGGPARLPRAGRVGQAGLEHVAVGVVVGGQHAAGQRTRRVVQAVAIAEAHGGLVVDLDRDARGLGALLGLVGHVVAERVGTRVAVRRVVGERAIRDVQLDGAAGLGPDRGQVGALGGCRRRAVGAGQRDDVQHVVVVVVVVDEHAGRRVADQ